MQIERKKGSFHDLVFTVDLSNYGKTEGDIDDILFCVKEQQSDPDNTALLTKQQSLGEVTFTSPNIVNVQWPYNEYDNFAINKIYYAGLFLKFTGDPTFDENVDTIFTLKITQGFTDL